MTNIHRPSQASFDLTEQTSAFKAYMRVDDIDSNHYDTFYKWQAASETDELMDRWLLKPEVDDG